MFIDDYEVLSVLSEELNMRKAAERLFITQPALSQRLNRIEEKWGRHIFLRTTKGLMLTEYGELIVKFAKEMLQNYQHVQDKIDSLNHEIHGTLKIAVASIVGQYWLPKRLKGFVENHPQVKISLVTGWSNEVLKRVHSGEDHVGIVRGDVSWRGEKKYLFSDELFLVDQTIDSISQLEESERPFIQFKSQSNYYQEIEDWWLSQFSNPPKRTVVVDQIETCKQMALNGIGYSILPGISLNNHDQINKISLSENLTRDTWLIYNQDSLQLKQVEALVNHLTN